MFRSSTTPTTVSIRGLDPTGQSLDRVETVNFPKPGMYLVICGVLPHFAAGMYGWVQVLPTAPGVMVLPPSSGQVESARKPAVKRASNRINN